MSDPRDTTIANLRLRVISLEDERLRSINRQLRRLSTMRYNLVARRTTRQRRTALLALARWIKELEMYAAALAPQGRPPAQEASR